MYGQIVTVLKEKDPIPSLEDVINSLQEYEKKLKGNASGSNTNGAYLITQNRQNKNMKCIHCGRINQKSQDCFQINPCKLGEQQIPSSKFLRKKVPSKH